MLSSLFKQQPLSEDAERQIIKQHALEIHDLLPVLGPLFGIGVILFGAWDYWVDPRHASLTLLVRLGFVLAGAIAYRPTRLQWNAMQRYGFIYFTHASAIIVCEFILKDGFLFGLPGATACLFTISVATLRIRTFLLIMALPFLLFIVLTAIRMPLLGFINGLSLYVFSICLAMIIMRVIRFSRQKAFLLETELTHMARHDSLTGVCNRRYLTELAEREVTLAQRHQRSLAVALIDIDHFKRINDTYGHEIGDLAIKSMTATCLDTLRRIDHIGRIGGEEFVCILPETGPIEAMACAERLRQRIEASRLETPQGSLQFTVSIGVTVLGPEHTSWKILLRDADRALYRAKQEGRNRVVFASYQPTP